MANYESMELWQLFHYLDETSGPSLDKHIANRINDIDELFDNYYLFVRVPYLTPLLPLTLGKVNLLIIDLIENPPPNIEWWKVSTLAQWNWLNKEAKDKLLEIWFENDEVDFSMESLYGNITSDSKYYIRVLEKLIKSYKIQKSRERADYINSVFMNAGKEHLQTACELLEKSTPAVTVCLLNRKDIPDEFIIKGLKALSKLSKQRNINIKVDFQSLEQLGPKMRLDAMKHLMGIMDKWNRSSQASLPFKTTPTRAMVEEFLFPCSFKYNDQVAELLKRYDEITNPKKISGPGKQRWKF